MELWYDGNPHSWEEETHKRKEKICNTESVGKTNDKVT